MYENIEKFLRINNYLNFEGPLMNYTGKLNKETYANQVITKTMVAFLNKYKTEISKRATFVVKYDNDLYSYLALRIIHFAVLSQQKTIDIRILGKLNKEEQEFFKDFKTISYRNAKKLKNCILITGFNPIFNVDCLGDLSKVFVEIYNPIERLDPTAISMAMKFYIDEKSFLYDETLNAADSENTTNVAHPMCWEFYTYKENESPLYMKVNFEDDTPKFGLLSEFCYPNPKDIYKIVDKDIPIVWFRLKGTEEDFPLYKKILESSAEGNIHVYSFEDENGYDFTRLNLGTYIDYRNCPRPFNTADSWASFIEETCNTHCIFF